MIQQGTTFWGSNPDDPTGKHLWFVLSDPSRTDGRVLIANMTSRRRDSDPSCILVPGDHPGVTCESAINYGRATITTESKINKGNKARPDCIVFHSLADLKLVKRILEGAKVSRRISGEAKAFAIQDFNMIDEATT